MKLVGKQQTEQLTDSKQGQEMKVKINAKWRIGYEEINERKLRKVKYTADGKISKIRNRSEKMITKIPKIGNLMGLMSFLSKRRGSRY